MMTDAPQLARPDDFDALAPETFGSAYATYADLRENCPIAWSKEYGGFWMLTRYADIVGAVSDHDRFVTDVQNVVPDMAIGARRPPLGKNPPEHTPYRRALDRTLSRKRIDKLESRIRLHAVRELDRMIGKGQGDMSSDFATIYPAWIAAEWLNLSEADVEVLATTARLYNMAWRTMDIAAVKDAGDKLDWISDKLVEDRIRLPLPIQCDPASSLLAEEHEGEKIPRDLVVQTIRQALVVGLMAPPPLFGSICVHLSRHPDLQDMLRKNPDMIPDAVEELLRLYVPYRGFGRTTRCPVELHGRTINPGEAVAISYSAANRDPEVFERPDEFIMNRPNIHQHVAFGRGAHHCAGAAVVRLEFRIALEELLARTSHFEVVGDVEMTRMPELGPISTPVRFH